MYGDILGSFVARYRPFSTRLCAWRGLQRHGFGLASGAGGSGAGKRWIGGSEAGDKDSRLPAGELVPVSGVRERLGEHRSGDDDVDRSSVWPDGPVAASAGEDLPEEVSDLALEGDNLLVMDDGTAVEREDELVAGCDRLFEKPGEGRGGRLVAPRGGTRVFKDKVEGAERQRGQQGRPRRVMAVEGSDPDARPPRRSLPSGLSRRRA